MHDLCYTQSQSTLLFKQITGSLRWLPHCQTLLSLFIIPLQIHIQWMRCILCVSSLSLNMCTPFVCISDRIGGWIFLHEQIYYVFCIINWWIVMHEQCHSTFGSIAYPFLKDESITTVAYWPGSEVVTGGHLMHHKEGSCSCCWELTCL